jgi:hypothetical protein
MAKRLKAVRSRSEAASRTSVIFKSKSAYADGAPLHRVQYLETKLILKTDRFKSVESFDQRLS